METLGRHDKPSHIPVTLGEPTPTDDGILTRYNEILTESKKEESAASPSQEAVRDYVFKTYLKQAEQEDKLLVDRWSKTCDVLLVFSALQSAIIVAFNIYAETDNDEAHRANVLLQSILHRLDNSTALPTEVFQLEKATPSVGRLASSCWYVSLACSMLAAFGSLLGKQWVMHYESQPSWADTTSLRCRLRELRHEGYKRWKVDWFMDGLVMLLQSSVLAFAIGLTIHLSTTSTAHFSIVLSSTIFGAAIFGITLITGTLIPGCPFKSSITGSFYRILKIIALSTLVGPLVSMVIATWVLNIAPGVRVPEWLQKLGRDAETMMNLGFTTIGEVLESGDVEYEALEDGHAGLAGVICWWLIQEGYKDNELGVDTKHVVEEVFSFPKWVIIDLFVFIHPFTSWSLRVINNLRYIPKTPSPLTSDSSSSSTNPHLEMGDILCHLMHDSWVVRNLTVRLAKSKVLNSSGEFCSILRKAWCHYKSSDALPVSSMPRWPTISLYLELQFKSWSDLYRQKDKSNKEPERKELERDLAAILQDPRLKKRRDVANALTLTTLILVNRLKSSSPDWPNKISYPWRVEDRFTKALDLLSTYPNDASPEELVVLAVQASANYFTRPWDEKDGMFAGDHDWWNAKLPAILIRLLDLGKSWHSQVTAGGTSGKEKEAEEGVQVKGRKDAELQEKLMNETWRMMSGVAAYLNTRRTIAPTWYSLSDENDRFKTIVQWCCESPTGQSHCLHKFQVLAFILRLRCTPRTAWRFLPWGHQDSSSDLILAGVRADCKRAVANGITDFKGAGDVRRAILSLLDARREFFFDDITLAEESLGELLKNIGKVKKEEGKNEMAENGGGEGEDPLRNHWDKVRDALAPSGEAASIGSK